MMRNNRIFKAVLTPLGRTLTVLAGLVAVAILLSHAGLPVVLAALTRAAPFFPVVLLLEAGVLACTMCALRLLYGEDRHRLPTGALIRAGLIGYSVMGLVPAGRTFAESTRAAILSRYSSGPRALVAAAQLQGLALLANAAVSFLAMLAIYHVLGPSVPAALIAGNMLLTASLGAFILLAGQRSGFGTWLGKRFPRVVEFGQEFDLHFSGRKLIPLGPFVWEFMGRLLQVLQNGVLVVAVGGALGILPAFCSEALHLVGAAAGDLIPAQLGATEFNYGLSARALSLSPADALSIALLAHLAQLAWVAVGLLVQLLGPITPGLGPALRINKIDLSGFKKMKGNRC